ncbi:MAG: stage V sporulation protein AA [Clostridium sp.]|nr:stage V sporulation protein AA [Clostridium sp.]MCM1399269.1 stage V sporulation protein AA [Clostridium sp.]MCM1459757.1 stage V sporulation protein AA [Bacteroides sp.]
MENKTLYFSLEQSTLVSSRQVHIGDIATVFCSDRDISHTVEKTLVTVLTDTEQDQLVISAMKLVALISKDFKDLSIVNIGSPETIVYYRNLKPASSFKGKAKSILLMVLAFFGTAYSIMSYNCDVGSIELLNNLYTLFTKETADSLPIGLNLGMIAYSIGLCAGMILFFNHGINKKKTDDPTPLQVQMRLYEQDVNTCIILDSARNNETLDVD